MSVKRTELKVGVFVAIALLILGGLIIAFSKDLTIIRRTYTINLHTANVGGIKRDAGVLMAGVPVGNLSRADLNPDGKTVTLVLRILKKFTIRNDATFIIEQSGFLGDQYIAIYPKGTSAPPLEDGATVECKEPFNLQEVARAAAGFIERMDQTAKQLNEAIARVDRVVLNQQSLSNLAGAIVQFREAGQGLQVTLGNVDRLVTTNSPPIQAAVSNLVTFSGRLDNFGKQLNALVETNSGTIHEAVQSANDAIKSTKDLTARLDKIAADLQAGKGLVGGLLQDDSLKANVVTLTSQLSVTASNLSVFTGDLRSRSLFSILFSAHKDPKPEAPSKTAPAGRAGQR